ncbi:hypothetical protein GCM10025857_06980 [Alicyclobacillus contaminans]|uniref:DUF2971 domain-containing protein n=1 Tax=Alicyclobacillus contaminans TaxID=392016 RepID=UPI00047AC6F3|nr:DUF2971 domain-containing protein [Alicyclobacillus contaminans]GMA49341.1 hypothetical protein GCM10025857_06980 [Alicyclobacillus contaminans]
MHYYRFRPSGELAIKELMYDEIYFTSTRECNDPFDGKTFLTFEANKESWKRLLEFAWGRYDNVNKAKWEEQLSDHLSEMAPLSFDSALGLDYTQLLLSLQSPPDPLSALVLGQLIKKVLTLYKPNDTYFVSFSRTCKDILMWSHYATMHKGHCLIFKAIDGSLRQCPKRKRNAIRRTTRAGLAPSMSWAIPDSFSFQEVTYSSDSKPGDAFSYFPEYVFGKKLDEQERIKLITEQNRQYLVKHDCWSYEKESRLTLSPPYGWLFGENVDLSPQERLFHYQPSQLVGIILGARMEEQQKMRFREIIREHMDRISRDAHDYTAVFDFVLFQAKLPDTHREVVVSAEEIFGLTDTLDKNHHDFDRRLNRWKEGWAMVFHGRGASWKKFD